MVIESVNLERDAVCVDSELKVFDGELKGVPMVLELGVCVPDGESESV